MCSRRVVSSNYDMHYVADNDHLHTFISKNRVDTYRKDKVETLLPLLVFNMKSYHMRQWLLSLVCMLSLVGQSNSFNLGIGTRVTSNRHRAATTSMKYVLLVF